MDLKHLANSIMFGRSTVNRSRGEKHERIVDACSGQARRTTRLAFLDHLLGLGFIHPLGLAVCQIVVVLNGDDGNDLLGADGWLLTAWQVTPQQYNLSLQKSTFATASTV